jgi:Crp-like helix-turn-helix domain
MRGLQLCPMICPCALATDFGSDIHISQEQLGIYVGAARETVNRQLQEWRRQGILEMGRNLISLLKMNKLVAGSFAAVILGGYGVAQLIASAL